MTFNLDDNSSEFISSLTNSVRNFLEETGGEIEAQAKRNTAVDTGKLKASWSHKVVSDNEVLIGSTEENAIWEEFGTGEYALEGNGRKGGWYIPIGNGDNQIPLSTVKKYHFKIITIKGKQFAFTKGKKPKRTLHNAMNTVKPKIKKVMEENLKTL